MNSKKERMDAFIGAKRIAVVGASGNKQKFGNSALKALLKKGYDVVPIHSKAESIDGLKCYATLLELPFTPDAVLIVVKPLAAQQIAEDAIAKGIKNIWFQQGAESSEAAKYCMENGVEPVTNECIMMFVAHTEFPHNIHRFINKVVGKLPV